MAFDDLDENNEIISEGPTSTVTRIVSDSPNGPRFIAVKTSTRVHAKEPHDIVKEVRLLTSLSHPNIIPLIKQQSKPHNLSFWMPYIPHSLNELLECSRFSPHPIISFGSTSSSASTPREAQFVVLAKSIIFQVLCGVNYLHSEHIHLAHRDIKPANILLTELGRVQIIDFGIAFRTDENDTTKARDLWSESTARMYFEVSTGPYRAPELLFGPRSYDAFAIDAWSLGATFAEFFTSLRLQTSDEDEDDASSRSEHPAGSGSESESDDNVPLNGLPPQIPFMIPRGTRPSSGMPTGRWARTTLFDGTRGEIGLAWSIFRVRGTPAEDTWPSFLTLPDASKVSFIHVDALDLSTLLPNLPLSSTSNGATLDTRTHAPSLDPIASPLDLVHRFLVYEPSRRLRPSEALVHPWFRAEPSVMLPVGDDSDHAMHSLWEVEAGTMAATRSFTLEGKTLTLGELLHKYASSTACLG